MSCKVAPSLPPHFLPLKFTGTFPNLKVSCHLQGAPNISGVFDIVPDDIAKCFAALSPRSKKEYTPKMEVNPTVDNLSTASIAIRCDKLRGALFEHSVAASKSSEDCLMEGQAVTEESKEARVSKREKRSLDNECKKQEQPAPKKLHRENAKLIRKQQRFRKGCWRMVSTRTGVTLVSISTTGQKSAGTLAVRILDSQLDVRKWRSTIVTQDQVSRVFTSTSNTLNELIKNLKGSQILKSKEVENAFRFVDRALFVCRSCSFWY